MNNEKGKKMENVKDYLSIYSINDLKYELKVGAKFIAKFDWLKILFSSISWYTGYTCNKYTCERGTAYETLSSQIEFWGLFEGVFRKIFVIQPIHYVSNISHFVMCKLVHNA